MFEILGPGIDMNGEYVEDSFSVSRSSINELTNIINELCSTSTNLISQSKADKSALAVQRKRIKEIKNQITETMDAEYFRTKYEEIQNIILEEQQTDTD